MNDKFKFRGRDGDKRCTGIKDENGNLIFEGDIVRMSVNDVTKTAPVYYDSGEACFWMGKDKDKYYLVPNDWLRSKYEIIGNIHEGESQ